MHDCDIQNCTFKMNLSMTITILYTCIRLIFNQNIKILIDDKISIHSLYLENLDLLKNLLVIYYEKKSLLCIVESHVPVFSDNRWR